MTMLSTVVEHTYCYHFPSEFYPQQEGTADSGRLALAVDSSAFRPFGKTEQTKKSPPVFFNGTLLKPKKICDLLRGVSEIVNARFNNPNWKR